MGIVSQETVLFNDTVKAKIANGALDRFTPEPVEVGPEPAEVSGAAADAGKWATCQGQGAPWRDGDARRGLESRDA